MSKVRRMEGMAAPGQSRYVKESPGVLSTNERIWRPVAGTDLVHDSVINFDMTVNVNEIIR
jgi:hypothetical protein